MGLLYGFFGGEVDVVCGKTQINTLTLRQERVDLVEVWRG
jgi:hypothetical protein